MLTTNYTPEHPPKVGDRVKEINSGAEGVIELIMPRRKQSVFVAYENAGTLIAYSISELYKITL